MNDSQQINGKSRWTFEKDKYVVHKVLDMVSTLSVRGLHCRINVKCYNAHIQPRKSLAEQSPLIVKVEDIC